MTTPSDPNGKPASDTLISDRPPIEEDSEVVPYRSEEATAINHSISEEAEEEGEPVEFDPNRTMPAASLFVDSGIPGAQPETERAEISGKNAAAPMAPVATHAPPAAPTLVHDKAPLDDEVGDGSTERLPAPPVEAEATAPRQAPPGAPTNVGPLPDRSPGASLVAQSPEAQRPQVQQWRVVPSGRFNSLPLTSPGLKPAPKKPRGLQTVLWSMDPMADGSDEDEDENSPDLGPPADYQVSGGTIARAAQTYIMEAIEMLGVLREFSDDLDAERGRELLSNVTGCSDRLRRALALLATSGGDVDE